MFSDLPEEKNASKASTTPSDGTVKGKTKPADEATLKQLEEDNKTIRGHLLNHMSNTLFNLFVTSKYAKIIWEELEVKYGADDAQKMKYMVGEWV